MKPEMHITERELRVMTVDLDEMHHEFLPGYHKAIGTFAEAIGASVSRRGLLRGSALGAAAMGGGLVLAACGGSSSSSSSGASNAGGGNADLAVARLAASIEVLAVNTYDAALVAATQGKLGAVPPAVATFATTAKAQHSEHQSAWNSILTGAGQMAQTQPDPKLQPTVTQGLQSVKNVVDVAKLALTLESIALATYVSGASAVSSPEARKVAATIAPVEAQHAAILRFILGMYPDDSVASFVSTDQAASPTDLGGS